MKEYNHLKREKLFRDRGFFIHIISQTRDKVDMIPDTKVNSFANYNPALYTTWVVVKK